MRQFIYFSKRAVTTGNFKDLMSAGRMDIAIHIIIMAFFVSNKRRDDVKVDLFFYGHPDPPKHLEIYSQHEGTESPISKKDVAGLIKRMLYKYKKGMKFEALPACFVEKKGLLEYMDELEERNVYLLDRKGEDIRTMDIGENPVFILGDHEGFPPKEFKRLKKAAIPVSLGNVTYFASQSVTIVNHELDRRGL
ncbi:tRNA (pseudouridine(54)-N(1))-methyltransferase TrmY [Candidatus Woesearchaeota archaeon]|nr:MAG: tRNA (pseudouridine(54)-N(1))-methyltransferase TrmY [Candidatus Woesearchaeota archaeon]